MREPNGGYKHHYDKRRKSRIFKVGQNNIILPTDHSKLLLPWRCPYKVVEVLNRVDYKVDVDGKREIHANLLKLCISRVHSKPTAKANEVNVVASVAIIEPGDDDDVVDDEGRLDLLNGRQQETYQNVNIDPDLTPEQTNDVWSILEEFKNIFTEQPGCIPITALKI